jgi:WD40 repeat protein
VHTHVYAQLISIFVLWNQILDMQQGKRVHRLYILDTTDENMTSSICAIVCHPTRRVLVTASCDGTIHIWDTTTYRYAIYILPQNKKKYTIHPLLFRHDYLAVVLRMAKSDGPLRHPRPDSPSEHRGPCTWWKNDKGNCSASPGIKRSAMIRSKS